MSSSMSLNYLKISDTENREFNNELDLSNAIKDKKGLIIRSAAVLRCFMS